MRFVTKQPFYQHRTTKIYPKIERERTRQIESNDVFRDVSTTRFSLVYKDFDHNSQSVANNSKEKYERERKFRNKSDHPRLCVLCELIFVVRFFWVTLI